MLTTFSRAEPDQIGDARRVDSMHFEMDAICPIHCSAAQP
jgi:hypothetical protein